MKNVSQAGDALQRLALQYADISAAAAEIQELGGLKALRDALTADVEKLRVTVSTERDAAERASNERIEIERACGEMRERAKEQIRVESEAAAQEVAKVRADAKAKADALITKAQAQADEKIGAIGGQLATMQAKLDDLNKDVANAEAARDAALAELESINNRIAAAKETIQKMMGA